jgi:hypothetical protein
MNPELADLINALPSDGSEITYDALATNLKQANKGNVLRKFHEFRRSKFFHIRLDKSTEPVVMYVSRQSPA